MNTNKDSTSFTGLNIRKNAKAAMQQAQDTAHNAKEWAMATAKGQVRKFADQGAQGIKNISGSVVANAISPANRASVEESSGSIDMKKLASLKKELSSLLASLENNVKDMPTSPEKSNVTDLGKKNVVNYNTNLDARKEILRNIEALSIDLLKVLSKTNDTTLREELALEVGGRLGSVRRALKAATNKEMLSQLFADQEATSKTMLENVDKDEFKAVHESILQNMEGMAAKYKFDL